MRETDEIKIIATAIAADMETLTNQHQYKQPPVYIFDHIYMVIRMINRRD